MENNIINKLWLFKVIIQCNNLNYILQAYVGAQERELVSH